MQVNINEYQKTFLGSRSQQAYTADVTAICEPTVQSVQSLTSDNPTSHHSLLHGQIYSFSKHTGLEVTFWGLCSGGAQFESCLGHWYPEVYCGFPQLLQNYCVIVAKLGYDRFLPDPFPIHYTSYAMPYVGLVLKVSLNNPQKGLTSVLNTILMNCKQMNRNTVKS